MRRKRSCTYLHVLWFVKLSPILVMVGLEVYWQSVSEGLKLRDSTTARTLRMPLIRIDELVLERVRVTER